MKSRSRSDAKVHATHCCEKHGCKYGDKNCPVVTGKISQMYPCEDCCDETLEELQNKSVSINEISKILKDSLSIKISDYQNYDSSGIEVKLIFNDKEISSDRVSLKTWRD